MATSVRSVCALQATEAPAPLATDLGRSIGKRGRSMGILRGWLTSSTVWIGPDDDGFCCLICKLGRARDFFRLLRSEGNSDSKSPDGFDTSS